MKTIMFLVSVLTVLSSQPTLAQSDYYTNFLNKKIKTITINVNVLDTCNYLQLDNYECETKKRKIIHNNYKKLISPSIIHYSKGALIEKVSVSDRGGIITREDSVISQSSNDDTFQIIVSSNSYPLYKSLEILFGSSGTYSSSTWVDTSYVTNKNGRIVKEDDNYSSTFYIYQNKTETLNHRIRLVTSPKDFELTGEFLDQCLAQSDQYLPSKENDELSDIAMGGLLGTLMLDTMEIKLGGREDYLYDKKGNLVEKVILDPPFVDRIVYSYNASNQIIKKSTYSYGEFGEMDLRAYKFIYDKNNYRWDASVKFIYNKNQLVEVRGMYGDLLYRFEYDKQGRVSKEIDAGRAEFLFTYN